MNHRGAGMNGYRCYFLTGDNHISGVVQFQSANDAAAIERAHRLFEANPERHSGFEVWHLDQKLWPRRNRAQSGT
ncbi:MAG TPA: hypothetical protein VKU84_17235 [Stellaceae bacterium]|nr:hypothetical protein [Stellaceae bacterium]